MTLGFEDKLRELELLPVWKKTDAAGEAACATTAPPLVAQAASPAKKLFQGEHSRGYLPHLKAQGAVYAITFRLADSLPASVLAQWESLPDNDKTNEIENWLDAGYGECLLHQPELAGVVKEALLSQSNSAYMLHAWCIMPNHVHLVLEPAIGNTLSDVLQRIKSWSAHQINQRLGRSGALWQRESYDHLVRDDADFVRCCDYVRQNPVRAGLADSAESYAFCDLFAGGAACATTAPPPVAQAAPPANMDWQTLQQAVSACQLCDLAQTRTQTVFGVGDPDADWLFVGEAPGAEEDRRGEPFVGAAGQLLDNMLAAIRLKRGDNVYIANVLKCRPPGNRDPKPEEVAACDGYLKRQVALIKPRLIIALGRFAAEALLETDAPVSSLRGKLHQYQGVPLIVTYHPACLLRNLPDKALAWEDLCFARTTMQGLSSD